MDINMNEDLDYDSKGRYLKPIGKRFFSKALDSIRTVYTKKILESFFLITKTKSSAARVVFNQIKAKYKKSLKKALKDWKSSIEKTKNILSGLKILQKHDARRQTKKPEKKKNEVDMIRQERAANGVVRGLNRAILKLKNDFFLELVKVKLKEKNIDFFTLVKYKRMHFKLFWGWKKATDKIKENKRKSFSKLSRILLGKTTKYFSRIVKDVTGLTTQSYGLGFSLIRRIENKFLYNYFRHFAKVSSSSLHLNFRFAWKVFEKVRKNKLKTGWDSFLKLINRAKAKKTLYALKPLQIILTKLSSKVIFAILNNPVQASRFRLALGLEKVKNFTKKPKKIGFSAFKSLLISKFQRLSAGILSKRLNKKLFSHIFQAFKSIKSHSNKSRTFSAFSKLFNSLYLLLKTQKSHSIHSIKSFVNLKNKIESLWKAKFYQLEGFIQHQKKQFSLKLKFQFFSRWKKFTAEVLKIRKKILEKRSSRFANILKAVQERFSAGLLVYCFISLKTRWQTSKVLLLKLSKHYDKQLVLVFFERFKRRTINSFISPNNRRSFYSPYASFSQPSPLNSIMKSTSKRFGFYSTKRLSIDHSVHKYIDQMIRVVPPLDRSSLPSNYQRSDLGQNFK